jgi:DNA replication protein DnaC
MINPTLLERAKRLGLYGLIAHGSSIEKTVDIEALMGWEEVERSERGLKNRIKQAKLGEFKFLSDFDWNWPTKCDRAQIEEIIQLDFIKEAMNVIILGPNGVGKSMIAANLIYQGILSGQTGLFVTASQMLNDLKAQDSRQALNRRFKYYASPMVLNIDEVGYLSYSNAHADLLFEVISRRYKKRSTIITTNKPFAEWNTIFPNAACVVSLIDRLIHASEIVNIEGPSFRLKEAKESSAKRSQARGQKKSASKETSFARADGVLGEPATIHQNATTDSESRSSGVP